MYFTTVLPLVVTSHLRYCLSFTKSEGSVSFPLAVYNLISTTLSIEDSIDVAILFPSLTSLSKILISPITSLLIPTNCIESVEEFQDKPIVDCILLSSIDRSLSPFSICTFPIETLLPSSALIYNDGFSLSLQITISPKA